MIPKKLVSKEFGQQCQNEPNHQRGLANQALIPLSSVSTLSAGESTGTNRIPVLPSEMVSEEVSWYAFLSRVCFWESIRSVWLKAGDSEINFKFNTEQSKVCLDSNYYLIILPKWMSHFSRLQTVATATCLGEMWSGHVLAFGSRSSFSRATRSQEQTAVKL